MRSVTCQYTSISSKTPVMPRRLPKRLLVLVELALILAQRLDALAAMFHVKPCIRQHLPHRLNAVLHAQVRHDGQVVDAQVFGHLLDDRLALSC